VPTRTLNDLVGGVVDEDALREIGIEIEWTTSGGVRILGSPSHSDVRPSLPDVASGYVTAWGQGSETLQKWARLVLGLTDIDLAALEDDRSGDALLQAIWDAAEGSASGIDLATQLASR
jgi:hypothetical protein